MGHSPLFARTSQLITGLAVLVIVLLSQPAYSVNMCYEYNSLQRKMLCGNGECEVGEVCDDGEYNSDLEPNACRPDCRYAYCGDLVTDRGEECDDGYSYRDNPVPNRCRPDCSLPRCGDGIVDNAPPYNEQCDDANADNTDGCLRNCQRCITLGEAGGLVVSRNTQLCPGTIRLSGYGDRGAIIIKRSGITLDCNGLQLNGEGRGIGINIVRPNSVTIKNCHISGFDIGIKGDNANNITLSNNRLCSNRIADIQLSGAARMSGNGNACNKPGSWRDSGKSGCSSNIPICNPATAGVHQSPKIDRSAGATPSHNVPPVSAQPGTPPKARPATLPRHTSTDAARKKPAAALSNKTRTLSQNSARAETKPSSQPPHQEKFDLAISKLHFNKECKPQLTLENLEAKLPRYIYQDKSVVLHRFEGTRKTMTAPLLRVDKNRRLLHGKSVVWIDNRPLRAGAPSVRYQFSGIDADTNAGNNTLQIKIPPKCRR